MVFQQRKEAKQLLDGVVSAMKTVRKWRGWEEMKNAEQWCFSMGNTDERLSVFQQREKLLLMVFQQWKGEKRNKCWTELFRQ
jgi:hypothetical protein